jgi:hypothetical protein
MSSSRLITIIGFAILIIYIVIQLFNFYGVGQDVYGIYLSFLIFLIISSFVLPTKYPSL